MKHKKTGAEALLRRRAFYFGIPCETLRTAMARREAQTSRIVAMTTPVESKERRGPS